MASIPALVRQAVAVGILFVFGLCYVLVLSVGTAFLYARAKLGRFTTLGRSIGARVRRRGESTP